MKLKTLRFKIFSNLHLVFIFQFKIASVGVFIWSLVHSTSPLVFVFLLFCGFYIIRLKLKSIYLTNLKTLKTHILFNK